MGREKEIRLTLRVLAGPGHAELEPTYPPLSKLSQLGE